MNRYNFIAVVGLIASHAPIVLRMSAGKDTVSVADAGKDFATGNINFNAKAMDTDHDGTISKDEFMK